MIRLNTPGFRSIAHPSNFSIVSRSICASSIVNSYLPLVNAGVLAVGASSASSASIIDKLSAMTSPRGWNPVDLANGAKNISHGPFENIVSFGNIFFINREATRRGYPSPI